MTTTVQTMHTVAGRRAADAASKAFTGRKIRSSCRNTALTILAIIIALLAVVLI